MEFTTRIIAWACIAMMIGTFYYFSGGMIVIPAGIAILTGLCLTIEEDNAVLVLIPICFVVIGALYKHNSAEEEKDFKANTNIQCQEGAYIPK